MARSGPALESIRRFQPLLYIWPVPNVPLPEFNEWQWEISMPVSPVVNDLGSGET